MYESSLRYALTQQQAYLLRIHCNNKHYTYIGICSKTDLVQKHFASCSKKNPFLGGYFKNNHQKYTYIVIQRHKRVQFSRKMISSHSVFWWWVLIWNHIFVLSRSMCDRNKNIFRMNVISLPYSSLSEIRAIYLRYHQPILIWFHLCMIVSHTIAI